MGAQGTAVLDFGAFPGSSAGSVDVNTVGVVNTSAIEAWIRPVASADHTDADHIAAPMKVTAMFLSNDNIRIFGFNTNDVVPPVENLPPQPPGSKLNSPYVRPGRQNAPMFVGQFNVWWVWN
jgi:hypothetical protein